MKSTLLKRLISLILALMMMIPAALAEDVVIMVEADGEVTEIEGLSEEEDSDALAEAAAELTEEEEALMADIMSNLSADEEGEIDEDEAANQANLECNQDLPNHVVNILLLGIDNRSVELETGRSDAMIICSINRETGSVKLTSIARDTAVQIPGYKNTNRINVAFKFGSKTGDLEKGAELAMKTVNRNFGTNISRYVLVNIHGLADIIDALGGVDIELTKAEAKTINYELFVKEPMDKVKRDKLEVKDGVQHLDGMLAVTYGRIRNLNGQNDINRNSRQRKLLETLLSKVMDGMNIATFLALVDTALPYGRTNLTMEEILSLGAAVLSGEAMQSLTSGGAVLEQFAIPMEKQYGYRTFDGTTLIYISKKRLKTTMDAWQEFVYGETFGD